MNGQPPSKELIRNLRAHAEDAHDNGLTGSARTCARAADEIERLQILVTERLETFIQTAGKDRRVLADYIATHEPQPAASNQWGIDEAFKTLQLLTNGSPSATGAMSFLRSQIERLQQYVGLLERQNQKQSQTISESQRSTPLHGGGGASNEPPVEYHEDGRRKGKSPLTAENLAARIAGKPPGDEREMLMLRSVGAMEIAEGNEGWERVPIDCPMLAAVKALRERYDWLANRVLYCDYGDNQQPGEQIGWGVRLNVRDGKQFMYGPSIDQAIDACSGLTKSSAPQAFCRANTDGICDWIACPRAIDDKACSLPRASEGEEVR